MGSCPRSRIPTTIILSALRKRRRIILLGRAVGQVGCSHAGQQHPNPSQTFFGHALDSASHALVKGVVLPSANPDNYSPMVGDPEAIHFDGLSPNRRLRADDTP